MLPSLRHRAPVCLLTLVLLTLFSGCTAQADTVGNDRFALATDDDRGSSGSSHTGKIIEGSANPFRFAPKETTPAVDADAVNFKALFEQIGEDGIAWYQHVQTLADPFFEGRVPNSRGHDLAADYIEFHLRQAGLEPGFPDPGNPDVAGASFRQPFTFTRRTGEVEIEIDQAAVTVAGHYLKERQDFVALGNSSSGAFTGPVSFVGYGIENGPDGYDSFDDDTDLSGRIALLLRYEPLNEDGRSQWVSRRFTREFSSIEGKMQNVKDRGAAAIMLVSPPGAVDGRHRLERLSYSRRFGPELGIPVIQITPEVASMILGRAHESGRDLTAWRKLADTGEVRTVHLAPHLTVSIETQLTRTGGESFHIPVQNVAGILPGRGPLAEEYLVIGGHYDHVGHGKLGGIRPGNLGQLHPGADDNASGAAGVLVLADMLAHTYAETDKHTPLRSICFLTFDAEEMGLHGSRQFTRNPPIPLDRTGICLNMDMIGRLRSDELSVLGVDTGEGLQELLRPHFEASGLTVAVNPGGSGASDDALFHRASVPALHFFTGMHREYTSPADRAFTVNPHGAVRILNLIHDIALDIASRDELLAYTEPSGSGSGPPRRYAAVRLGIRPGMAEEVESGVYVDGVSDGTSAAEAGMKRGDIIVAWDGDDISNMRDLFQHLQKHKPGDVVTIGIIRHGEALDLTVTLKPSQ